MTGAEPPVLYSAKDGIARLTLNRPEQRNALSAELMTALREALLRAAGDADARVVVLTGAGERAFCAGGDLAGSGFQGKGFTERHHDRGTFADLFRVMNRLGKPLIARVRGHCLAGGLGLALGCDLVVACDDSSFGTPEIRRGLFPMMIMPTIFRNIGRMKGMELLLTGDRIDALSPAVLRLGRDAFYSMSDMEFERALDYLQGMLTINLGTEDAIEGVRAFLEKRTPVWKGK